MGLFSKNKKTKILSLSGLSLREIDESDFDIEECIKQNPKIESQSDDNYMDEIVFLHQMSLQDEIDDKSEELLEELNNMPLQKELCDECFDYNCNGHDDI